MHERERGLEPLVDEIGIEVGELSRDEHALVDERASGQRREVRAGLVFDALAGDERPAIEGDAVERRRRWRRGTTA